MKSIIFLLMALVSISSWADSDLLQPGDSITIETTKRIDIPFGTERLDVGCLIIEMKESSQKNRFIPEGTEYKVSLNYDNLFINRLNNLIPEEPSSIERLIIDSMRISSRLSKLNQCLNASGLFKIITFTGQAPEEIR